MPQEFSGDAAHSGTVLDDDAGPRPVQRLQQLLEEEARAGHDRAEHARMPEEVAREQEDVSVPCPTWCLRVFLHFIPRADLRPLSLYSNNCGRIPLRAPGSPAQLSGKSGPSAAGAPRPVAEPPQLAPQPVTMLAMNLDDALCDATARAAQFLQPPRELGELRLVKGQSA